MIQIPRKIVQGVYTPCSFVSLRRSIVAKRTFDRKADIPGSGRESVKVVRRRGCVLLGIIRTSVDVIGYQVRRVVSGSLRATKNSARQQVERSGHPIHPLCYWATLYTRPSFDPGCQLYAPNVPFSTLIGFRRAEVSIRSNATYNAVESHRAIESVAFLCQVATNFSLPLC